MLYKLQISPLPHVVRVGHIKYRHGWTSSYCHSDHVIIHIVSGQFSYVFKDGRQEDVLAGCIHLIPAGTEYTVTAEGDCDFYYIHFSPDCPLTPVSESEAVERLQEMKQLQAEKRLNDLYDFPFPDSVYVSDRQFLGEASESVRYRLSRCDEYRRGTSPLDCLRLQNSFFNLLLTYSSVSVEALTDRRHQPAALLKLIGYVEDNYTRPITLAGLADEFGFSKQYIMRLFRDNLGTTVSHYVNGVKLRKAQDLLRFTGLSVGEVAYSLGYSSSYYFCRLFKEAFTLTPTEYQKSYSQGAKQ